MFVGAHILLAAKTNTPELVISEDEGAAFMKAAQNVLRHYSVETTQKTLDWIALLGVAGGIYGTRVGAIMMRNNQEKKERRATGNVTPFPGAMTTPAAIHPDNYGDLVTGE